MKRVAWLIYANISLFCFLLVLLELVGQLAYWATRGHTIWQHQEVNPVFELHPYLVGGLKKNIKINNGEKTLTTTKLGTRYTGADSREDTIKVALLGGSTTFGTKVTDSESWAAILQGLLGERYSVTNYGVPGYTTAEAIVQMALIIPELRPDFLVFYMGWNDIRNYHTPNPTTDYYSHGIQQYSNLGLSTPDLTSEPLIRRLIGLSAIVRFAHRVYMTLPSKSAMPIKNSSQGYTGPDPYVDKVYLRNLKTLLTLSQQLNARALFVPQILNYEWYRTKKGTDAWTPFIQNAALPNLMSRFNEIMRSVCSPGDDHCLFVGEAADQDWKRGDFVDEGHFSKQGGEKFAAIIANTIKKIRR